VNRMMQTCVAGACVAVSLWATACNAQEVTGPSGLEQGRPQDTATAWQPQEFLLSAYNPPFAWHGPPYEDSVFTYYKDANFDNLLWVRDDDALMQKVHEHGFTYFLDVGRLIGEDVLRGSPDGDPPGITEEMLQDLDAAIAKYRDDPDLIGYYLCDEPFPSGFQNIATVVQRIRQQDPARVSFVNLWPYFENEIGDDAYIEDFIQTVQPEVVCSDRYNFFGDAEGNTWDENDEYFAQLERLRRHALLHGIPFCNIIQAVGTVGTSVGYPECEENGADECLEWRTPNSAEHRWLVYSSLAYGVHGIIWFHWDHEWGVTGNPDRDIIYPSIQSLNGEIAVLKDIMLHLTTTQVYHTDDPNSAGAGDGYVEVAGDAGLVVGLFEDEEGNEDYFMIMNKDYAQPVDPVITINAILDGVQVFNVETNQWEDVPFEPEASGVSISAHLREGGGKLFRIDRCVQWSRVFGVVPGPAPR